jgi:DNA polymerase-4
MDAFFASVEQLDNINLKGKPLIVGRPGKRGVVSTCSYEARRYGIRSAMPIEEARKRCPAAIFVPPRMKRYQEISGQIMKVFKDFSPEVNVVSIDEAYLDMTGTKLIFGTPEEAAVKLKEKIKNQFGLTFSVGIAPNRMLEKLSSEYKKPDGLYRIREEDKINFLDSLKLKDLWGIGKKTLERFNQKGITSIKQLRSYSEKLLTEMFGETTANYIYKAVRGDDPGIWSGNPKSKSIGNEITFEEDTKSQDFLKKVLLDLAQQVMFRLNDSGYKAKTVSLKIKYFDFSVVSAQKTLPDFLRTSTMIYKNLVELLDKKLDRSKPVRLIGAYLMSLEDKKSVSQINLFEEDKTIEKMEKAEKAVQQLSQKCPNIKIFKATALKKNNNNN